MLTSCCSRRRPNHRAGQRQSRHSILVPLARDKCPDRFSTPRQRDSRSYRHEPKHDVLRSSGHGRDLEGQRWERIAGRREEFRSKGSDEKYGRCQGGDPACQRRRRLWGCAEVILFERLRCCDSAMDCVALEMRSRQALCTHGM